MDTAEPGTFKERVFGISLNVCDLDRPTLKHSAADDGTATHFDWMILHVSLHLRRMTEVCDLPIGTALLTIDRSHVRLAQRHLECHHLGDPQSGAVGRAQCGLVLRSGCRLQQACNL